ncbi:hypothetical protein D3C86_1995500 [compost metagenome]
MRFDNFPGNGQPEAGAPHIAGAGFVHPVKPLKDPFDILLGNAYTGIPDGYRQHSLFILQGFQLNHPAFRRILQRIGN